MPKQATVLFVDDEENILNSLRRGLIDEEYRCIFASSGQQALEMLEKEPVSVIVSDMRMPEMDGLTLLKEVKNRYPKTVRVVLSGYAQLQQIILTLNQANIFKFILKPWKLEEEFKGVILQALEYHRLQEERDEYKETLKMQNQAYQNILRKFEDVIAYAKRNAEVQALIGSSAFDIILNEINIENSPNLIKRKVETASIIVRAILGISFEKISEKSMLEFSNEMKEKITSKGVKTLEIGIKTDEIDTFKTNTELIYSLSNAVVDLLSSGEARTKNVKISCQMDKGQGERMFSIYLVVENLSDVKAASLKMDLEQHLDACIIVLNPLLSHIMRVLKGSFHCARVDCNVVAKFKFLV